MVYVIKGGSFTEQRAYIKVITLSYPVMYVSFTIRDPDGFLAVIS